VTEAEFKARTKKVALGILQLAEGLPRSRSGNIIGRQMMRSATSVGANYRAACRAKSTADMIAKLSIVEEEADETLYWLEHLSETDPKSKPKIRLHYQAMEEILAMTVSSIKTLRHRQTKQKPKNPTLNR